MPLALDCRLFGFGNSTNRFRGHSGFEIARAFEGTSKPWGPVQIPLSCTSIYICLHIDLCIYICIYILVYIDICRSMCKIKGERERYIYPSIHLSMNPSNNPSIHPSYHPSDSILHSILDLCPSIRSILTSSMHICRGTIVGKLALLSCTVYNPRR